MTDSASTQPLMFPAFIYGEHTPCHRKMKAEAKKWTKTYLAGRDFPEPKLMPITPGSVVVTDVSTAHMVRLGYNFIPNTNIVLVDGEAAKREGHHVQWRIYLVDDLRSEALPSFADSVSEELRQEKSWACGRAMNAFFCKYPWGAITAAGGNSFFSDIEAILPRMGGVLQHWEGLDTLKYLGAYHHPISLAEYMVYCFCGELAMWVDQPTGNVRTDLQTAMQQMHQASADEIHKRLLRHLRKLVDVERDLKHRDWLRSPGIIERGLEAKRRVGQQWYDNLTSGEASTLRGFLVVLERNYGPGGDLTLP